MADDEIKRKIAKVIIASRKTLDPNFRAFWKNTAKTLAATHNVNLSEIENTPEYYIEIETRSYR